MCCDYELLRYHGNSKTRENQVDIKLEELESS